MAIERPFSETDWLATPEPVRRYVEQLEQRIQQLETTVAQWVKRIEELENRLNQNSKNSSKPPSSDPPYQRPERKSNQFMKEMAAFDLEDLLGRVTETGQEVPEDVRQVFSSLVQTTLDFRDRKLKEFGTTVTVEDVRIALGWLMDYFQSGQMPQTSHLLRRELFDTWVADLSPPGTQSP